MARASTGGGSASSVSKGSGRGAKKTRLVKQRYTIGGKPVTVRRRATAQDDQNASDKRDLRTVATQMKREGESNLGQGLQDRYGKSKNALAELRSDAQRTRKTRDRRAAARKAAMTRKARGGR